MSIATKESNQELIAYPQLLAQIQALSTENQVKLVLAVSKQFMPIDRVKVILPLLPLVAPTVEAFLLNKIPAVENNKQPEVLHRLLNKWIEESAEDEDDGSWDEIMRNIGAYPTKEQQTGEQQDDTNGYAR